mmetsp:Transcript_84438/g.235179  ORF Transcript_84438/g.235179 Transcript_84438/m.235179 type:complete len:449 (-) Transcript_84438:96-1442(-)
MSFDRALLALAAAAVLCAQARDVDEGECTGEVEEAVSAMQMVSPAVQASKRRQQMVADSDKVHIVCTCDCGQYCEWQSELMFYSAQRVGQRGPITSIHTECSPERAQAIARRHAHLGLPENYRVHFFEEKFNENGTHVMNKPLGVRAWFREVGPERDVLAVIDPDFVFLKPLTPAVEGSQAALGWPEGSPPREVRKGVVAAQRWAEIRKASDRQEDFVLDLDYPINDTALARLTPAELRTWVCSGRATGSSGCTHTSNEDVWLYHASGPPMLAHKEDWDEWLADSWRDITLRLRKVYHYYFVDMWSWMLANIHHGKRELIAHTYQYGGPSMYEPWGAVAETVAELDPCEAPMEEVLANPGHATFLHFTWTSPGWNKRWFKHQIFERCDADANDCYLRDFVSEAADKSNMTKAFTSCVMRRFMAAAFRRTCGGRPTAALVEPITAGFSL